MIGKGLVIPEGTEGIPMRRYRNTINIGVPVFPASLKKIGASSFSASDIKLANLPEGLEIIDKFAFAYCDKLKKAIVPSTVKVLEDNAFFGTGLEDLEIKEGVKIIGKASLASCQDLKKVELPKSVEEIQSLAFSGSAIENFVVHKNVKRVGIGAFNDCKDVIVETENGTRAKVPSKTFFYETIDLKNLRSFINKRSHRYNFIPNPAIINNTPENMIENFYSNSRTWEEILKTYCKTAGENGRISYHARKALYKISLAIGLFSENGIEREKAKQFLLENIVEKYEENVLINKFEHLNTKEVGFNKDFAEFVLENYTDVNFLEVDINNDHEKSMFSFAYNGKFTEYIKSTNKIVKTNKRADKITEEGLKSHIVGRKYPLTEEEQNNEKIQQLANYCATFGYSQKKFETLKDWLKEGTEKGSNIKCLKDTKTEGMTFELLDKSNPLGAVLGAITNCCQQIGDTGENCVKHGMTDKNGGFIAFRWNDRIIGQAWVWYNPRAKKICLDNIEVPASAIGLVEKHDEEFYHCVYRTAESLIKGMKEQAGVDIEIVTTGIGHNDTAEILQNSGFKTLDKEKIQNTFANITIATAPTGVYTDTKEGEIVLWEK